MSEGAGGGCGEQIGGAAGSGRNPQSESSFLKAERRRGHGPLPRAAGWNRKLGATGSSRGASLPDREL